MTPTADLDLTGGFVVRRTVGLGDTLFALNAVRAYKDHHPDTPIWFEFGEPWACMRSWFAAIIEQTPTPTQDLWTIDFDDVPTDLDQCRYEYMAAALGVEATDFYLPWALPADWVRRVECDYPSMYQYTVLSPWCGGSAVTRSLPDRVIDELLAQDEWPMFIQHPEAHGRYDHLPNSVVGRCPLPLTVALCARAKAVVSVDTGTAYLAASMNKPTVIAYTHIDPLHRLRPQANVAWVAPEAVDCCPCGDFPWPPKCPDGGLARCAHGIASDAILDALRGLLCGAHPTQSSAKGNVK